MLDGIALSGAQDTSRRELEELVLIGAEVIRNVCSGDDMAVSVASGTSYEPSGTSAVVFDSKQESLHQVVKSDVARLQSLSFSIRTILA